MDDDESYDACEMYGCDDVLTYEDEDTKQFECRRCGAEWWEDVDA